MSKLHVKQIAGYITKHLSGAIDISDCANHTDAAERNGMFLTRGLAVLAAAQASADTQLAQLASSVTDGQGDGGIDLIHFDPKEHILYLVQSKWHEDGHGSISLGDALKFIEGAKKVLDNDLAGLNAKIAAKSTDIGNAVYDAGARFVLLVAHTGQDPLGKEVKEVLDKYVDEQNDTSELMTLKVLSQSDLHRAIAAGAAGAPIKIDIQLAGWGRVRDPHDAFYGRVCATDVANWMGSYGLRLFEANLRQFIGVTAVNTDIVGTLQNRPTDFWYFNNGITAIARSVHKKPIGGNSTDSGVFECEGFCVVNGAQTVGSIHAAWAKSAPSVAEAMVPIRIIQVGDAAPEFALEVTRYTNTQNAVEKRDFVALDPEQERVRKELQIEGVEYSYKTGATVGTPGAQKFDLVEATVALACLNNDVSLAVQAKREISKLWEDISKAPYKQLFHGGVPGPQVWDVVQTLRRIDEALSSIKAGYSGRDALICTHGNRFIEWAVFRDLGMTLGTPFGDVDKKVAAAVQSVVDRVRVEVKAMYPDSYPASLFKNASKCRILGKKLFP